MSAAYLDTSFLLAILFAEPRARALQRIMARFDQLYAADLILAESLSAARREGLEAAALMSALESIALVLPDRSLESEMREALGHGYLRGADLWHLACAMFLGGQKRAEIAFLSRDNAQQKIARRVGFMTP